MEQNQGFAVDLYKAIQSLLDERDKLDRVISSLEELVRTGQSVPGLSLPTRPEPEPRKRRGRKSMDPEARREVSERMRKYWEQRRRGAGPKAAAAGEGAGPGGSTS